MTLSPDEIRQMIAQLRLFGMAISLPIREQLRVEIEGPLADMYRAIDAAVYYGGQTLDAYKAIGVTR